MNIKTGNPFSKNKGSRTASSFSRFVLPFAYSGTAPPTNDYWYRLTEPSEHENLEARKDYFTSETATVLFDKTAVFQLNTSIPPIEYLGATIGFNAPKIVLFEGQSKAKVPLLKTGFLILELYFDPESEVSLELFFEINELFRYKTRPYDLHRNPLARSFCKTVAEKFPGFATETKEKRSGHEYDHWETLLRTFFNDGQKQKSDISWDIYKDTRTFVWTCAVMPGGTEGLVKKYYPIAPNSFQPDKLWHWVKFLNVDPPRSNEFVKRGNQNFETDAVHKLTEFEQKWVMERTYRRWEHFGSLYGFSYHSGAAIIPDDTEPPFWEHFGQMYFDMFLLLIYVRVTVFRFSGKLTEISKDATERRRFERNITEWRKKFEELRWQFTLFTNLYQFPLISNQQQMIEMYVVARKALDLDELYAEVKEEIHNNHEFIEQRIAKVQSDATLRLTRIATVGLAGSLVIAFLGIAFGQTFRSWLKESTIAKALTNADNHNALFSSDWSIILMLIVVCILLLVFAERLWSLALNIWSMIRNRVDGITDKWRKQ